MLARLRALAPDRQDIIAHNAARLPKPSLVSAARWRAQPAKYLTVADRKKKNGAPPPEKKNWHADLPKQNRPKITFFFVFTRFLRSYAKTDIKFEIYAKNYVYRLIFSTVRPNFIENMSDAV